MGTLSQRKVNIPAAENLTYTLNTMSSDVKPKVVHRVPSLTGPKSADRGKRSAASVRGKKTHSSVSSAQSVRSHKSAHSRPGSGKAANDGGIVFTNVPSLRDKMQAEKTPATEEVKHSTERRIVPHDVLEKCQEGHYSHVYDIDLNGEHIICIENLDKFTKLRVLDLSNNYIRRMENLHVVSDLRDLKLYNNQIENIQNLDKLSELCTLHLQQNKIKEIGKGLHCLRKLRELRLDSNYLHKLDVRELASLGQLTSLDLSSNKLDDIGPVCCLPRLEELFATNNNLKVVPDLSRCKQLSELDVSYNRVADLSGLKNLQKLTVLTASHNLLTSAHMKTMGKHKRLEELHISHNRVTELQSWASGLPGLQILDVMDNKVPTWQAVCALKSLPELVELYICGNPFCSETGDKPHYFTDIQTVMPRLQIIDGAQSRQHTENRRLNTPLMRPMSASSVVSSRQVEGQIMSIQEQLSSFELTMEKRFATMRDTFSALPAESPFEMSGPGTAASTASSRPISKCSKRSRIQEARAYAAQQE